MQRRWSEIEAMGETTGHGQEMDRRCRQSGGCASSRAMMIAGCVRATVIRARLITMMCQRRILTTVLLHVSTARTTWRHLCHATARPHLAMTQLLPTMFLHPTALSSTTQTGLLSIARPLLATCPLGRPHIRRRLSLCLSQHGLRSMAHLTCFGYQLS